MTEGATRATRSAARQVLAALALFAGLLMMHGMPSQGCAPTAMTAAFATPVADHVDNHGIEVAPTLGEAPDHRAVTCVATRAPRGFTAWLALLGLIALAIGFGVRAFGSGPVRHALPPPLPFGRHLLTSLGISRT